MFARYIFVRKFSAKIEHDSRHIRKEIGNISPTKYEKLIKSRVKCRRGTIIGVIGDESQA